MEVFATPFVQNKPTGLSPTSVAEYPFLHTQVCLLAIFLVLLFSNFFVLFLCMWRQEQHSFIDIYVIQNYTSIHNTVNVEECVQEWFL